MGLRRRYVAAGAVLALLAAAGVGAALLVGGEDSAKATGTADRPTEPVTRGTLQQAQEITGELGLGSPRVVTGTGEGIITWLPSAGLTVARGEQLYRVDDAPVSLFHGSLPLYRTLSDHDLDAEAGTDDGEGDASPPPPPYTIPTGNDVDLVARNLAALGHYDGPTDGARYDARLAGAVRHWQEAIGAEATGVLHPSDVVVSSGPVRVEGLTAQVGTTAAQDVLTVTGTGKVIILKAPVQLARSLSPDRRLSVTLPDGTTIPTRITAIGTDVITDDNGGEPTVAIRVKPLKRKALASVALGPVTARVVTATHRDVLSVPLGALLALSGGGYAVERPDHALVPVTLGMVTEGRAEVSGIEEGAAVVVAR